MRLLVVLIVLISAPAFGQEFYGEKITKDGVEEVADALTSKNEVVKISGDIVKTCPNKGCWMMIDTPEGEMRVTFKDYGFFVPKTGVEGKKTIVEGKLTRVVTDVETLRHFAEDAGKSKEEIAAITEPKEELSFVASGVIIE